MTGSDQDEFQALLKKVLQHMRANNISTSDMMFILGQHEREDKREALLDTLISTDPVPVEDVMKVVSNWAYPRNDFPPPGTIVICIDGDEHVLPISLFRTDSRPSPIAGNLLETFVEKYPGVFRINLPKGCKSSFSTVIDMLKKIESPRSLIETKKLKMRNEIRETLVYLGLQSLDVPIAVKAREVLSRYGEVTWCTNSGFEEIIFSVTEDPKESAKDTPMKNDWGNARTEAFLIDFGRSRVIPDMVRIDAVKPDNEPVPRTGKGVNYRFNRFRMWVMSPEGTDVIPKLEALRKEKEADKDYLGLKAPEGWKVLGMTELTRDSGLISIPIGEPVSCQCLAVMFVSIDSQDINLKVGRFQVLGRGCLRL